MKYLLFAVFSLYSIASWSCPLGGERVSTGECCKDNYEYNERTGKYDLINGHCGCPNGGTPKGEGCCKDGIYSGSCCYSTKTNASYLNPEVCGCPENGVPVPTYGGNIECCQAGKTGYRWINDSYSDFTPEYCGCPDGGEYGFVENKWWHNIVPYCCKNGYAYDKYKKSYSNISSFCK